MKAISFLQMVHPATPWALASFGPGENEIGPARTFDPTDVLPAGRFIAELQGKHNIYFTVNCVDHKLTKKASKSDIAEIHYLHVDADLNKNLSWFDTDAVDAEKALRLEQLQSYDPPPTAIIWSGGGYQAYWRLSENLRVGGDKSLMEPVERRMQAIEKALGADPCHNADRIMRLPGTLNVLGKTKIAAGRRPALAEVVEFHEDRIYDLKDFPESEASPRVANRAGNQYRRGSNEIERIGDALRRIPPDDYDTYLKITMALKSELGDAGFGMCRDWAMQSVKFDEAEFRRKWTSIKPEGDVTIRTLFGVALDHGWSERLASRSNAPRHDARRVEGDRSDASSDIGAQPKKADDGGRRTQATALIEIATGDDVDLFHTPDGTGFADIIIDGHRETWSLKSPGFRRWLRRAYYQETGGAPNSDAMSTAMGVIEARAHFDGVERPVHLRVAEASCRIYLDLCDPGWRVVEIDAEGWRIVDRPPVRFRRTPGMLPLPVPVGGGSLSELRKHLHVDDNGYVLLVSWLLASLRPRGPYPVLGLTGEQGTGKSLTAYILRSLIDPHSAPNRGAPRDTRDLYVAAINGHVLVFDNLSSISAEISDCLCRLSTGGGFTTRALYTDDTEVIFDGQRPIALTSIADVASRSDLADRLVIVRLEVIPDDQRRTEEELLGAFEAARSRILGALLDAVAHGLMQLPHTRLNRLPRMADYAVWVRACETAIWSAGMHMAAYEVNRADAVDVVLDTDPIAVALRQHMEGRSEHTTTATDLLATLGALVSDHVRRGRQWPGSPKGLSGQLTRLAPALRRVGVTITSDREGHTGRRLIHIVRELEVTQ